MTWGEEKNVRPGGVESRPKTCEDTKGQEVCWKGGSLGMPRTGRSGVVLGTCNSHINNQPATTNINYP